MPSKQLQPSTSSSTASSTILPSSISSTSTTATYPPIPYPLVSPASSSSSATYPPIPYPRKSSVSVSSNRTSTASTSTSTSTSSDKGYHTSVSNIPLSPISLASWKSAEDTTSLASDERGEGGVSTPTVGVVGLPGQVGASPAGKGLEGEGVVNSEDGQGERDSTWVRARTDLYPVPASTSVVSSLVLDGGAITDASDANKTSKEKTDSSGKQLESTVKQNPNVGLNEATKILESQTDFIGEGPINIVATKASGKLDGLGAKDSKTQAGIRTDDSNPRSSFGKDDAQTKVDDPSSKKKSVSLGNDSEGVSTVQAVQTSTKAKEGASEGGEKMIKDDKELVGAKVEDVVNEARSTFSQANQKPKKDSKDEENDLKKDARNTNTNIKDSAAKVEAVGRTTSENGKDGVKAVTKQTSSEDVIAKTVKDGAKSESKEGGADVSKSKAGGKGGSKQESGKVVNDKEEKSKKTSVVNEAGGKESKGKEGSAQVSKVAGKPDLKGSKEGVHSKGSKGSKEDGLVGGTTADIAVKDKSDLKEGVGAASVPKSGSGGESNVDLDLNTSNTSNTSNTPNLDAKPASSDNSNPTITLTLPMTPSSIGAQSPRGVPSTESITPLSLAGSVLGDVKQKEGMGVEKQKEGVEKEKGDVEKEKGDVQKVKEGRMSTSTIGSIPSSSNSHSRPTSILRPSITTTTTSGNVVSRHTHSHSFAYSQPPQQQHPQHHQQQQKRSFSASHSRHQSDTSTSAFMVNHTLRFDAPASTSTSTSSHATSSLPSISTISSHPHPHNPHHPHHYPHTPSSSTSNWGVNANTNTNATAKELTNDLLSTMKQTLSTMGATFDVLGEQTVKVAVLPAVLDVFEKIAVIRQQLEEQHVNQEGRMQEMKTMLLEEVRMKVYGRLKEVVESIVRGVVAREVQRRVRRELYEQIPQKMRDEVEVYKRQIVEVRVSLHNSEARRHNALIRANSLDEPLIPLLRPPPQPLNISIPSIGSGSAIPHPTSNSNTNKALSAYTETEHAPPPLPLTARVFSESQAHSHSHIRNPKKLGKLDTGVGRLRRELGGAGGAGGEVGTPSPFFPRDLMGLMRMGGEDAKMLLREYGLVRVRRRVVGREVGEAGGVEGVECVEGKSEGGEGGEGEVGEVVEEEEEETREESINRFLAYIGVGFQVVPSPDAPTGVVNLARVK